MDNVQDRFRTSSSTLILLSARLLSGLFLGLCMALIGQEIIGYASLSFVFVLVAFTSVVMRISRNWSWAYLFIFNLICVLIGLLLRMYILFAPTA